MCNFQETKHCTQQEIGVGVVFKCNNEWYKCIEGWSCNACAFDTIKCDEIKDIVGHYIIKNSNKE